MHSGLIYNRVGAMVRLVAWWQIWPLFVFSAAQFQISVAGTETRRQWWWGHCLFSSPRVCCQGSRLARAVLTFITPRTGQLWSAINWRHYSPEPGHENHQNLLFPHSDNFAVHPSAVTGIVGFINFYIDIVIRRRPIYMLSCKIENGLRLFAR